MLDLDHLSRQTAGNRVLAREILEIFGQQADDQIRRLKAATDLRQRREVAHAIVGSARAIGAFEAARVATEIERAEGQAGAEIAALSDIVDQTRAFIADILKKRENYFT